VNGGTLYDEATGLARKILSCRIRPTPRKEVDGPGSPRPKDMTVIRLKVVGIAKGRKGVPVN